MSAYRESEKLFEGPVTALELVTMQKGAILDDESTVTDKLTIDSGALLDVVGAASFSGPVDIEMPTAAPAEGNQAENSFVVWYDPEAKSVTVQVRLPDGQARMGTISLPTVLGPVSPTEFTFGRVVTGRVAAAAKLAAPTAFGVYTRGYRS